MPQSPSSVSVIGYGPVVHECEGFEALDIAQRVSAEGGREVTPWEVDHAIWRASRSPALPHESLPTSLTKGGIDVAST